MIEQRDDLLLLPEDGRAGSSETDTASPTEAYRVEPFDMPGKRSKKLFVAGYVTLFVCCTLLGVYFFRCYPLLDGTGPLFELGKRQSAPVGAILLFEAVPFVLLLLSFFTRFSVLLSCVVLSLKGLVMGFSICACVIVDGSVSFSISACIFVVYSVLYALSFLYTAAYASSTAIALHAKHSKDNRSMRQAIIRHYVKDCLPYLVLFLLCAVCDGLSLGF